MRLSAANLHALPADIVHPTYARSAQSVGIVHFGIGAFHRAHQAVYADDAMIRGEHGWGIIGVSLRSAAVAEQLNPQDGFYTLITRSAAGDALRPIAAVQCVLVASAQAQAVIDAIAAPGTHIISFTITEKGYCRGTDGSLDPTLADAGSIYPFLHRGLAARRRAGLPGLTLLSCDNLSDNGVQLSRLLGEYLARHDPAVLDWFQTRCSCPSSMVDRIVPATTPADRETLAQRLGMRDEAVVVTEPYSQWVIEDRFAGPRPQWQHSGVQLVEDVAPWEAAKLRMLNGAHSALAYLGLAHGHEFVHQAVADPLIAPSIRQLMLDEAAPTLPPMPGFDAQIYATALLARFANPALRHRLAQIAMDGSQKIPQRWLQTTLSAAHSGRDTPAILTALAAWIRHSQGANGPIDDPLAANFAALWKNASLEQGIAALFGAGSSSLIASLPDASLQRLSAILRT
ncbi:MAG: mannitol dehydrogenase family protein [Lysobacteraceae bacterium]